MGYYPTAGNGVLSPLGKWRNCPKLTGRSLGISGPEPMKEQTIELTRRYRTALGNHLTRGGAATLRPALDLGRQALVMGLDVLDLARVHEEALGGRNSGGRSEASVKRGSEFFNEALIPIAETHRPARAGKIQLDRLNDTLRQRTAELAAMNGQLERGIERRKNVEACLRKSTRHYGSLLKGSLNLQKGLRLITHRVLAAQENERTKMSLELQNEVAQTLLGINVRLLTLKQEAKNNTRGLKNEIASAQLLVANSARSAQKAARIFAKT
jgi:signal transduction histidine kinase